MSHVSRLEVNEIFVERTSLKMKKSPSPSSVSVYITLHNS